MLLDHKEEGYFARNITQPAERALAWVSWALFAHSPEVGLKLKGEYPAFW